MVTVESALRLIGFIDRRKSTRTRGRGARDRDPSGNGKQSVDESKLLEIVQQELVQQQELSSNIRTTAMAKWKQLFSRLPFHIALYILEYNEQKLYENHRELVGYFGRDLTRRCHLIFRSLNLVSIWMHPDKLDEEDDEGLFMRFIMRHARQVTVYSINDLRYLDQWMRPPMKTSIGSIEINHFNHDADLDKQPFCPAIFSTCKSLTLSTINDNILKFSNVANLNLNCRFRGADIGAIKHLPAHSLVSLSMPIYTQEHVKFLSDALQHLRKLKQLNLEQVCTGDMWSYVAVALRNAPPTLKHLTYFQHSWNDDDNMRVKITPGMFSSTLANSIEELILHCHVGDLTGLSEFSRLKSLSLLDLDEAIEVHNLNMTLCFVPSLTKLKLRFNWKDRDDSFTPVLSTLTNTVIRLSGLQVLKVTIYTFPLILSDIALAQFLDNVVQSGVKLHWSMYIDVGTVSFMPEMYRSFLTVLLHPELRHLLDNFYQEDYLYDSHEELYQAVYDMCNAIVDAETWQL